MPITGAHIGGRVARAAAPVIRNRFVPLIIPILKKGASNSNISKTVNNSISKRISNTSINAGLSLNFDFSRKTVNNNISPRFNTTVNPNFNFNNAFNIGANFAINTIGFSVAEYNVRNIVKGDIQTNSSIYESYHSKSNKTENNSTSMSENTANLGRSITDLKQSKIYY